MLTSRTATATKATQIPMSTATPCLQTVTVDMHMGEEICQDIDIVHCLSCFMCSMVCLRMHDL